MATSSAAPKRESSEQATPFRQPRAQLGSRPAALCTSPIAWYGVCAQDQSRAQNWELVPLFLAGSEQQRLLLPCEQQLLQLVELAQLAPSACRRSCDAFGHLSGIGHATEK